VSLAVAGAGCAGRLGGTAPEPMLQDALVRNTDDVRHTVAFQLRHEGEQILDATYELGPRNFGDEGPDHIESIDEAWESPRGEFDATVRVRDGTRTELSLDDHVNAGTPYRYEVRLLDGGEVGAWFSEQGTTVA